MSESTDASRRRAFRVIPVAVLCLQFSGCALSSGSPAYVGRRLPYTQEGRHRVYSFFYGTNRVVSRAPGGAARHEAEPGHGTRVGEFRVRLEGGFNAAGNKPSTWEGVELDAVDEKADDAFVDRLKRAVNASPSRSLLVVVFGYRESLETSALKTAVFAYRIDIDTPVMLFDWPGNQPTTVGGYRRAFEYARRSGADLGDLLALVVREVRPDNLWITGNSMGAQVVCDAFSEMAKEKDLSDAAPEIRHVLLAAPDVARKEFDDRFMEELRSLSERLTVYVSSDDTALLLSSWLHGASRLGRGHGLEPRQLDELEDLLALKAEGTEAITVIDFTPVNRASHGHNYYIESPEYFDDFYQRLQASPPVIGRRLHPVADENNVTYWILWNDEE